MVTIIQVNEFVKPMTGKECLHGRYLGSFFSLKSAEDRLGWFFLHSCCEVRTF